jgi:ubiquinone/menaquinone biosynthesis C-methylase UbiE
VEVFSKIASLEEEMRRLQTQADLFSVFVDESVKKIDVTPNMSAADVGCGTGDVSFKIAQLLSNGTVTGIDANPTAIDFCKTEARRRGISNVNFLIRDALKTEFQSHSFDLVYSRFLFQHLKDPAACLTEMLRIVKPGGSVMVEDCDLQHWISEPANEYVDQLWKWYETIVKDKGSNPAIGRKLYSMFVEKDLRPQVDVYSLPLSWEKSRMWDTIIAVMEKLGGSQNKELIEGIRNFKERKDSLFVFPLVFRVWAKVP